MFVRFVSVAVVPWLLIGAQIARADSLFEGIDAFSREMVAPSNSVWRGPRIDAPESSARPRGLARRDAALVPLSVHGADTRAVPLARVLAIGEAALTLWQAAGVFEVRGDGGQGGTAGYDLYIVPTPDDADSGVDASAIVRPLDAVRSFALLDPRRASSAACVAQALADALLRELDPAERAPLRRAGAAYFAWLATGDTCDAPDRAFDERDDEAAWATQPERAARYFPWLVALGARHDKNRGTFVADLFQLARQRTWEGAGLRASPSLLEAVDAALHSEDEPLVRALGELADDIGARALQRGERPAVAVEIDELPAHLPVSPALAPFATDYALVHVPSSSPGERLTIWSRGEYGVRWVLSAQRFDAQLQPLGRVSAKVRDAPSSELHVELYPGTAYVLVSITNGSGRRVPTLGPSDAPLVHAVQLVLDRRVGF